MNINIHWLAQLRTAAGKANEIVEIADGASLAELIEILAAGAEEPLRALLMPKGTGAGRSYMLIVNDQNITHTDAAKYRLADRDEVTLLPPISGG